MRVCVISYLLIHNPNAFSSQRARDWARLRLGSANSIQVLQMEDRTKLFIAIPQPTDIECAFLETATGVCCAVNSC